MTDKKKTEQTFRKVTKEEKPIIQKKRGNSVGARKPKK